MADFDHNGVVDWLDGAKLVRERMPAIPTHYYDDKLMYMIRNDEPKFPKPQATFAESEKIIQRVRVADWRRAAGRLLVGLAVSRERYGVSGGGRSEQAARRF